MTRIQAGQPIRRRRHTQPPAEGLRASELEEIVDSDQADIFDQAVRARAEQDPEFRRQWTWRKQ